MATLRVPVRVPGWVGVKVTWRVQLVVAARVLPGAGQVSGDGVVAGGGDAVEGGGGGAGVGDLDGEGGGAADERRCRSRARWERR